MESSEEKKEKKLLKPPKRMFYYSNDFLAQRRRVKELLLKQNKNEQSKVFRYVPYGDARSLDDRITEQNKIKKEQLLNEEFAQNMQLKKTTLNRLFIFLSLETLAIFVLAVLQGFKLTSGFYLEDWSFRLLVAVTISQITYMLQFAVKHLFPNSKEYNLIELEKRKKESN